MSESGSARRRGRRTSRRCGGSASGDPGAGERGLVAGGYQDPGSPPSSWPIGRRRSASSNLKPSPPTCKGICNVHLTSSASRPHPVAASTLRVLDRRPEADAIRAGNEEGEYEAMISAEERPRPSTSPGSVSATPSPASRVPVRQLPSPRPRGAGAGVAGRRPQDRDRADYRPKRAPGGWGTRRNSLVVKNSPPPTAGSWESRRPPSHRCETVDRGARVL